MRRKDIFLTGEIYIFKLMIHIKIL